MYSLILSVLSRGVARGDHFLSSVIPPSHPQSAASPPQLRLDFGGATFDVCDQGPAYKHHYSLYHRLHYPTLKSTTLWPNLHDSIICLTTAAKLYSYPAWQRQMSKALSRQCSLLWRPCSPTPTEHKRDKRTHSSSSSKSLQKRGRLALRSCKHPPLTTKRSCSLRPH